MIRIIHRGKPLEKYPHEISSLVLAEIKKSIKDRTNYDEIDAVITVPSYFNVKQRQTTKIAGFTILTLFNEPSAALMAAQKKMLKDGITLVVDIRGDTLDYSIVKDEGKKFQFLSVGGDSDFGGENIDDALHDYMINEFKKLTGSYCYKDRKATSRLKWECEKVKCILCNSGKAKYQVVIPQFFEGKDLSIDLTAANFTNLSSDIINTIIPSLIETIKEAKDPSGIPITKEGITQVILVGGSSGIPYMKEVIYNFFDQFITPFSHVNPDAAIALGACIIAKDCINGHSISQSNQDSETEQRNIIHFETNPLSTGIQNDQNDQNGFLVVFEANSVLPLHACKLYYPPDPSTRYANISIGQGESSKFSDNQHLCSFRLGPLPEDFQYEYLHLIFTLNEGCILIVSVHSPIDNSNYGEFIINISGRCMLEEEIHQARLYHDNLIKYKRELQEMRSVISDFERELFIAQTNATTIKASSDVLNKIQQHLA